MIVLHFTIMLICNALQLLSMVHKTIAGEKVKDCRAEAKAAQAALKTAEKLEAYPGAQALQEQILETLQEAEQQIDGLKLSARLQDLHIFKAPRITKKGNRYEYWHAEWREGSKVKTVYLGSCKKVSPQEALQKARALKKEALGIDLPGE